MRASSTAWTSPFWRAWTRQRASSSGRVAATATARSCSRAATSSSSAKMAISSSCARRLSVTTSARASPPSTARRGITPRCRTGSCWCAISRKWRRSICACARHLSGVAHAPPQSTSRLRSAPAGTGLQGKACPLYIRRNRYGQLLGQEPQQVLPIAALRQRLRERFELGGVDVAHAVGNLLRAGDLETLASFDDRDELRGLEHRLVRAGIQPRKSTAERNHFELVLLEVPAIDVRDL